MPVELHELVHRELCAKENLLEDQFTTRATSVVRRGRACGTSFVLQGPRSVRLTAVWEADLGTLYLYDARGERFAKRRVSCS